MPSPNTRVTDRDRIDLVPVVPLATRFAGIVVCVAFCIALTACSGGGHSSIASRALSNDELPGFTGTPDVVRGVSAWLGNGQTPSDQLAALTAQLNQFGFVEGVSENLTGSAGLPGLSTVEQFKTAGGARSELASDRAGAKAGYTVFTTFPVARIPGAFGFGGSGDGSAGINIAFAKGDYFYVVGEVVGSASSSITPGVEHTLDATAQHLYDRVSP